jgi:SEL1 protein
MLTCETAPKKDWSLSEWIANFMQDDLRYYEDDDYDLAYDDTMPGGDPGMGEGDDDGILESLAIVGVVGALVFLILYRQQRQQQARHQAEQAEQAERQRRQQQGGHAGGQDQGQQGAQAGGPALGDFRQWGAAAVGH